MSLVDCVIIAGAFQYINVEVTDEFEKICIIAYHGDSLPDSEDRSIGNYYRWEYDHGIWKDVSGHDSVYIKPSKCIIDNNAYYFYIGIDAKAKLGRWTVKILIDGKEIVSSINSVVIVQFNLFLTALIGVYKPYFGDKKSIINSDLISSDQKGVIAESKKNIDKLIDEVLSKHSVSNQNKDSKEIPDLCFFENTPYYEEESVKSAISNYPRSKFKNEQKNIVKSLFFNKKWCGGNSLLSNKLGSYKGFLVILLMIILISVVFVPIITPQDIVSPSNPVITSINVFPDCINLGNSILLNVTVTDSVGISSVVAKIGELDTINLSCIEGNIINDTIYSGFWQSSWLVEDINPGDYTILVIALNKDNRTVSQKCVFTVLPRGDNVNIDINDSLETEFNKPNNITQIEEQNNTIQNDNDTIKNEILNNISIQNTTNETDDNKTSVNQSFSDIFDIDNVFIADKRHEEINVLPGSRFYVERTIDGPHGKNVVFAPMFSDSLTLESIEILDNNLENKNNDKPIININKIKVFNSGEGNNEKEKNIEKIKEKLPSDIKKLNKIAYIDNIELNSSKTIRIWFRAPGWELLQNGVNPSGEISYLVFSDNQTENFDFEGSTWWNSNWGYRKLITINASKVSADLTNFPVLIKTTDSDLASYAQNDGDDIAFVLWSDNTTKINHEIEFFNKTSGNLVCWINVTYLSSTVNTKIWMYYGNAVCSNQQNPTGVWDSNYVGVWHLNGSYNDSTSYNNNGTAVGTPDNISGKIGYGLYFDGVNDAINIPHNLSLRLDDYTIECWSDASSVNENWAGIIGKHYGTGNEYMFQFDAQGDDVIIYNADSSWDTYIDRTEIDDTWYYMSVTRSGTTQTSYLNNSQRRQGVFATDPDQTRTGSLTFAQERTSIRSDIYLDEIRISKIARNSSWINTSFVNVNATNTFLYFDSKENITDTYVNPISPYSIKLSPKNISATGNSTLDNVTLYYRWSKNNWTNSWVTLTYDDFESGFGNYTDGGGDCELYTGGTYAHQGNNAADIQDNSGIESSFYHTTGIDVNTPGYTSIKVEFWFYSNGLSDGHDFWVLYYNGTSWNNVATYVCGTDFVNGQFYQKTVWINETTYNFPTNMQIRFQCDALNNNNDIYIDEIYVNATPASSNWVAWNNVTNPDTLFPWNWDFNFPYGTGYYEFYSIGKKSGVNDELPPSSADAICYYNPLLNNAPSIDLISPQNGSTGISLQPNCSVWVNDTDFDSLTVYWYENSTGSWILRNTNTSVSSNTIVNYTFLQFNAYDITYWWRVAVNDSVANVSNTYHFTTLPLATSVNPISPYEVKIVPLTINATGQSDLNNVSLYYRWSNNNFTENQWTILTYDDFESGFGNYTDGGDDCSIYTGPTYPHQGLSAVDIQDNSGDASSFYHTNGIDVNNPGYTSIKVEFWFYTVGMNNYNFSVDYFDGTGWRLVKNYQGGIDYVDGQFFNKTIWINESMYNFPSNMKLKFLCNGWTNNDDVYIDEIYVNATKNSTDWILWNNANNPDITYPWSWNFNFPYSFGYYEFYSIGKKSGSSDEQPPLTKDALCYYVNAPPVINSYDLRNNTGSKLNNVTGLLDVNSIYYFLVNISDENGWTDIEYVNITAWYDDGEDTTTYNQTSGGNINLFLQYENTTGTANWTLQWPDDEVQLIISNCTETIVSITTRIINISFKPLSQVHWACSNNTWISTDNVYNDLYSWNFNIIVIDTKDGEAFKVNEYGVYKYTSIYPAQDWVDVSALPGFNDSSNIVSITYSSNYNYNMTIYLEENLYNETRGVTIPIANNVKILADADLYDDITTDITFLGIGQSYAIDIFNESGIFNKNNVSQTVNVQFDVYIPIATLCGKYIARVATKIIQD